MSFVIRKIHKHQDAQRHAAFLAEKAALVERQVDAKRALEHRNVLQVMDVAREVRALAQIEARELKSYEVAKRRQARIAQRQGHDHMPGLNLALKPKGRSAMPHKAKIASGRVTGSVMMIGMMIVVIMIGTITISRRNQDIVIIVDRRPDDDRSDLRKAFGAAVKKAGGEGGSGEIRQGCR
ncbi:hypothetical protein [Oryzicola mucosus]|uniref:Uncharacterized protein n=1 Tax=Oryzicola mucosus TaxID=2767425 RepID=A0A8J6Q5G7_9HYPH|nr:hypothetical protein [Oryzicola mucosus]MBD0417470.1 hypothetical protein [Oryzicola mucosus]